MGNSPTIAPFTLHVAESAIADLHQRLDRTRWPDELDAAPWEYGANLAEMRRITQYWRQNFDWRAVEAGINRLPQFTAEIEGQTLHFIHACSKNPAPLPLLISHGWPGSFVEMLDIIPMLSDPEHFNIDLRDSFDVIVPSLPGYGFSSPVKKPGMTPRRIANLFARLMEALGYAEYGVQGGDWGAIVSTWIARDFAPCVRGIHLNWIPGSYRPPLAPGEAEFSERGARLHGQNAA